MNELVPTVAFSIQLVKAMGLLWAIYGYLIQEINIKGHTCLIMGLPVENFRGIEFVRISSMPKDQQERLWKTFQKEKIVKILKDQALMNDCILYSDFAQWQNNQSPTPTQAATVNSVVPVLGTLAFD